LKNRGPLAGFQPIQQRNLAIWKFQRIVMGPYPVFVDKGTCVAKAASKVARMPSIRPFRTFSEACTWSW
jgi:hypothetical protein